MLKVNEITGELEDDGVPAADGAAPPLADPTNPDIIAPVVPPIDAAVAPGAGAGGAAPSVSAPIAPPDLSTPVTTPPTPPRAPASGTTVNVGLSTKPEHETTVVKTVEGPKSLAADKELADARAKRDAAVQAETNLKVEQAKVESYKQQKEALAAQQEAEDRAKHQAEVDRLTKENLAADKRANQESAQDETVKNSAGVLTGSAAVISKILIAVGALGQGFAAAGSRGAAAWKDGNPVAAIYEEQRQKEIKTALDKFNASERARKLRKEGRDVELAKERDEITIGAANRAKQRQLAIDSVVKERLARYGPDAQRVGGQVLEAANAVDDATHDQTTARGYNAIIHATTRSPTGNAGAVANKPLSGETAEIVAAAGDYERLAKRQKEIIASNGGIPVSGQDSIEFERNDQAMAGQLQKAYGKSDKDAEAAAKLQGAPGIVGAALSHVPLLRAFGPGNVDNYQRALDTNASRLRNTADQRVALEGPEGLVARRTGETPTTLRDQAAARMPNAGKSGGEGAEPEKTLSSGRVVVLRNGKWVPK